MKDTTLRSWFLTGLTKEDSTSLLMQLPNQLLDKTADSLKEAISKFVWGDTIEGHDHWDRLYFAIHSYTKQEIINLKKANVPERDITPSDIEGCFIGSGSVNTGDKKNIIGYKAPYDLFQGNVKKGDIFSK
jgi:hypothetical protein